MSEYVIVKNDGVWVADMSRNPTGGSYTARLQYAKRFPTREAAERERCPGNETVQPL
jgi:hypothetical protein